MIYTTELNVFKFIYDYYHNLRASHTESISDQKKNFNSECKSNDGELTRNNSAEYFRTSSCRTIDPLFESEENGNWRELSPKLSSKEVFTKDEFKFSSMAGKGSYGEVFKAVHVQTQKVYAIKAIDKSLMKKEHKTYQIFVENEILNLCKHPNVIEIYGAFEDEENIYLVLEYCNKGSLGEFIKQNFPLPIGIAQVLIGQMINCIEYLHTMNIVHRDIKPDNFVMNNKHELKLIDFATASFNGTIFNEGSFSYLNEDAIDGNVSHILGIGSNDANCLGTAEYMAPEAINEGKIDVYTDIWSIGCIVYQMFTGRSPFWDKTEYLIFQRILNLNYPSLDKEAIPTSARDLICNILKANPEDRIGYVTEGSGNFNYNFNILRNHKFFFISDPARLSSMLDWGIYRANEQMNENSTSTGSDVVLKVGILKKRSPFFFYNRRKLILYSTPRIDYIDPDDNCIKGTILLNQFCLAEQLSTCQFVLKTPERNFVFLCDERYDISPWVEEINGAILNYRV